MRCRRAPGPDVRIGGVVRSPWACQVQVTRTHVVVSDAQASPIAVLPLERVQAVYPSSGAGGTQAVVLLQDGSWTTMQVPPGEPRVNRTLALALHERAELVGRQRLSDRDVGRWPGTVTRLRIPAPANS